MEQSKLGGFYGKVKKLNTLFATLSGIVLLFITLSITVDVFLRYVFGQPHDLDHGGFHLPFPLRDLSRDGLCPAAGDAHQGHVPAGPCFGQGAQRFVDLITSILAILFTVVLLWQTSAMTWSAIKGNWTTPTMLNAPFAWIHGIMVIGSFLLLVNFLCSTILYFTGEEKEPAGAA